MGKFKFCKKKRGSNKRKATHDGDHMYTVQVSSKMNVNQTHDSGQDDGQQASGSTCIEQMNDPIEQLDTCEMEIEPTMLLSGQEVFSYIVSHPDIPMCEERSPESPIIEITDETHDTDTIAESEDSSCCETVIHTDTIAESEDSSCCETVIHTDTIAESEDSSCCETVIYTIEFEERYADSDGISEHVGTNLTGFYERLKVEVSHVVNFPYILNSTSKLIQILELYPSVSNVDQPTVKLSITIDENLTAKLFVHRIEILPDHDFWLGLPSKYGTPLQIRALLSKLESYSVCVGSPDECFQNLVDVGCAIQDNSTDTTAYREGDFHAVKGDLYYSSTIRNTKCKFLVQGARCQPCSKVLRNLRDRKLRQEEKARVAINSPPPNYMEKRFKHRYMDKKELIEKIKQQKGVIKSLEAEVGKLKRQFQKDLRSKGIELDVGQNIEFHNMMRTYQDEVRKAFPDENSIQRLFWNEQMKCASLKSLNGMRWHPMVIRWCLFLKQKSSCAYEAMRNSGFITLPSTRTLFDYSHYTRSALGFQRDIIEILKGEVQKKGMRDEPWKSYVGVLFDEIKVKSDLVYDKHTGELIGYCDLDKVGNQIVDLEKNLKNETSDIAKFMLVLMVRGIAADLKFPLAGFATNSITADLLYSILWKAVAILEVNIKLKVMFFTCDGASPNRKFFQLHRSADGELTYSTVNPHCPDRKIYFISDVPHLLKTTRNCFGNSGSHKNSRKLWKDGKDISWLHILRLYEDHCELGIYNPCPKLTRAHVDLSSFSFMKVNLAAQVMSSSVAVALEMMYGENMSETINFLRITNKFFDCLNVRNLYEGRSKRNPDLDPFTDENDARLTWLLNDFLQYFTDWEQSVRQRNGNFTAYQKQGMQLSHQTLNGLKITVHSIVECVKFMLRNGARFVLTHSFNQDPLEQLFGHYRHGTGDNNNPTVYDVRNAMTSMRAVGAQALAPRRGNIRANKENIEIDNTKLPRRMMKK